jgi:dihydroorotase
VNVILRGLRVIDPLQGIDRSGQDVWLRDGRIVAIDRRVNANGVPVLDLAPPPGQSPRVLCPGFIDLHAHLREPGEEKKETVNSGADAAAAGGFTQVVAMANTKPPVDSVARVGQARVRAARARVRVLVAAALTRALRGTQLVDIAGCATAGAACFSDDGRNSMSEHVLTEGLRAAARTGRPVLVHPEDEAMIAASNPDMPSVVRCPERPVEAEVAAVASALRALEAAGTGHLHLQHISAAPSVDLIRQAKGRGLQVTAEVTPHHLSMWQPFEEEPDPVSLRKVNPPLRSELDRAAMVHALREGVIDAVATDHAPHTAEDKVGDYADAAPGMIGLETALSTCLSLGGMGGDWMPVLVARMVAGPYAVLGEGCGLRRPRLGVGDAANCTLFDPDATWTIGGRPFRSLSSNTPLHGVEMRGRVLLTLVDGGVAYLETQECPAAGVVEAFGER